MGKTSENLPARRRKKKKVMSFRLTVLIAGLVIIVAAAGALMAPGLNVVEVYCEGNVNLKFEEISAVSQIKTGTNILLVNTRRAEREIKKLPFVNSVEVKRILPNKICIRTEERVPAAYVRAGTEGIVIGADKIILKRLDAVEFGSIVAKNTPIFTETAKENEQKDSEKKDTEKKETENKEAKSGERAADSNGTENAEDTGQPQQEIQNGVQYNIPLIEGIEVKNTDEGKAARCDDKDKLQIVLDICKALENADMLNRSTYLDVSDLSSIWLIIENRLDVRLGSADNIEYRAKFLAEVVNTGISAYEKAVVDYRGEDIYVRTPDDGKARTAPKQKQADDDDEDERVDSESEKAENDKSEDKNKEKTDDKSKKNDSGDANGGEGESEEQSETAGVGEL